MSLGPRTRKAVAALGLLFWLAFWVWAAIAVSAALPDHWLIDLLVLGLAGLLWGVPALPLLTWAERGVWTHKA